ncbi:hypothetical protein BJ166DRAFT_259430 [Pestalotiopsis sp. NC0098]|nr:hypothetical protein BJ166DRAFT_259430 [Pestalotiopsis sp. NC0098]
MDSSHRLSNPLADSNEELSIKIRELYYRLKLFSDAIEVSRQQAKPSIVVSRADQERQDHGAISDTGYLSPSPTFQGNDERNLSTRAAFQSSHQLPVPNPESSVTTTNLDIDSRTVSCWENLVAVVFAAARKIRDFVPKGGEASHTVEIISASSLSQFRGSLRRISQGNNWVHEVKRVTQFVDLVAKYCHKITITTVIIDTPDYVHLAMGFAKTLAIGMTSSLSPELRGLLKRLVRLSKPFNKTLGNFLHAMSIGVREDAGEKLPVAHALGMLFNARAYIWTFVLDILLTTPDGRPISDFQNNVWAPSTSLSTALSRFYPEHVAQGVERQLVANDHFVSLTRRLTKQFCTNEYFCMDFLHNWVYDSTQFDLILLTSDPFRCFQFVIDAADLDTFKHARGQNSSLADILVLTGADNVACASPMGEYASKLWPELGPLLIGHLSQVLQAHFDGQSSTATVVYEPASGDESSPDLSQNLRFYSLRWKKDDSL